MPESTVDLREETLGALMLAIVVSGLLPTAHRGTHGEIGDDELERINKEAARVLDKCIWAPTRRSGT